MERWPQDGRKWRVTSAGGTRPRWRRDARALLFLRDGALMQITMEERGSDVAFSTASLVADLSGARDYAPANRSDRLIAVVPLARAESPRARVIADWISLVQ